MKKSKYRRIATALAVVTIPLLTACGSSEPTPANGVAGAGAGSIPGGGCVPLSSQIPFNAQGATLVMRKILAGMVPGQGNYGSVVLGGGVQGGGQYQGSGPYGAINMSILPLNQAQPTAGQYVQPINPYAQQQVTASGFVQISALAQQDILNKVQMGQIQIPGVTGIGGGVYSPYPSPYPQPGYPQPGYPQQPQQPQQQLCVSNIAISLNISNYNQLYIGDVYLYLNNTQHGYVLEF